MMGGVGAHEYMAPCAAGENDVALSDAGYAANVEIATRHRPGLSKACPSRSARPSRSTRRAPARSRPSRRLLGVPEGALIKAMPVIRDDGRPLLVARARRPPAQRDQAPERASARRRARRPRRRSARVFGRAAGLRRPGRGARAGARRRGAARAERARRRRQRARPPPARRGARPRLRGQLGRRPRRRGRRPLRRRRHDPDRAGDRGRQHLQARHALLRAARRAPPRRERHRADIWMGSYGIGPARIVAAAVEQYADEQGISWPRALAPFDVQLVTLGKEGEEARDRRRPALRRAARDRPRRALRRPRAPAPARSSRTPSCWGRRCG